jgi:hypothetical protein
MNPCHKPTRREFLSFRLATWLAFAAFSISASFSWDASRAQSPQIPNSNLVESPSPTSIDGYFRILNAPRFLESDQPLEIVNDFPIKIAGTPTLDTWTGNVEIRSTAQTFPKSIVVSSSLAIPGVAAHPLLKGARLVRPSPKSPLTRHVVLVFKNGVQLPVTLGNPLPPPSLQCSCHLPEVCQEFGIQLGESIVFQANVLSAPCAAYLMRWNQFAFPAGAVSYEEELGKLRICLVNDKLQVVSPPAAESDIPSWIRQHQDLSVDDLYKLLLKSQAFGTMSEPERMKAIEKRFVESEQFLTNWSVEESRSRYRFQGRVIGRLDDKIVFSPGFVVSMLDFNGQKLSQPSRTVALEIANLQKLSWLKNHNPITVARSRLLCDVRSERAFQIQIGDAKQGNAIDAEPLPPIKSLDPAIDLQNLSVDASVFRLVGQWSREVQAFAENIASVPDDLLVANLERQLKSPMSASVAPLEVQAKIAPPTQEVYASIYPDPQFVKTTGHISLEVAPALSVRGQLQYDRENQVLSLYHEKQNQYSHLHGRMTDFSESSRQEIQAKFKEAGHDLSATLQLTSPKVRIRLASNSFDLILKDRVADGFVVACDKIEQCEQLKFEKGRPFFVPRTELTAMVVSVLDDFFQRNPPPEQPIDQSQLGYFISSFDAKVTMLPNSESEVKDWIARHSYFSIDKLINALTQSTFVRNTSEDQEKRRLVAFELAAIHAAQHGTWSAQFGESTYSFQGRPRKRLEDGYLFDHAFFVPVTELTTTTAAVLAKVSVSDEFGASDLVDLQNKYRTRLNPLAQSPSCGLVRVLGREEVDSVYLGNGLRLSDTTGANFKVENVVPSRTNAFIELLPKLEAFQSFIETTSDSGLAKALKSRLPPLYIAKSVRKFSDVNLVRSWVFSEPNQKPVVSMTGMLQGRLGDQLLFSQDQSDDSPIFVVSESDFPSSTRKQIEAVLKTLPDKVDRKRLRVVSGKPYRIAYLQSINALYENEPIVLVDVDRHSVEFHRWKGDGFAAAVANLRRDFSERLVQWLQEDENFLQELNRGLDRFALRDSDAVFDGTLMAVRGRQFVFRDAFDSLLRIDSIHLEPGVVAKAERNMNTLAMAELSDAQVHALPTYLIGRTQLYGPGSLELTLEIKEESVPLAKTNGDRILVPLRYLTMRQQLQAKAQFAAKTAMASSQAIRPNFERSIPPQELIAELPPLLPELEKLLQIDDAAPKPSWSGETVPVDAAWQLKSLQRDAARAIFETDEGQWQAYDFGSNSSFPLPTLDIHSPRFGPWISADNRVWAVSQGKLVLLEPTSQAVGEVTGQIDRQGVNSADRTEPRAWGDWKPITLGLDEEKIVAADVSSNGLFLWAQLERSVSDHRFVRLDLATQQRLELTPKEYPPVNSELARFNQSPVAEQLVADRDGASCVVKFSDQFFIIQFSSDSVSDIDALRQQTAEVRLPSHITKANANQLVLGNQHLLIDLDSESPLILCDFRSGRNVQQAIRLPIDIQKIGFCDSGEQHFLKLIAKPTDKYQRPHERNFVTSYALDGKSNNYLEQVLDGTLDDFSRSSYDGKTWLHRKNGQHYRSALAVPIQLDRSVLIRTIVERLFREGDVGQLEAIYQHTQRVEQERQSANLRGEGEYILGILNSILFESQLDANGDPLELSRLYLDYLHRTCPDSKLMQLLQANWHFDLAWDYRGGGYADTVSEKRFANFFEQSAKASEFIEQLLRSPNPPAEVFSKAIQLHTALQRPKAEMGPIVKRIFASSAKNNPSIHSSLAFYLLPRWGGEKGEAERYLQVMTKTLAGDGPMVYAATLAALTSAKFNAANEIEVDQDLLLQGTLDFYEHYRNPRVLDSALLIFSKLQAIDLCDQLLRLRDEKEIGWSPLAISERNTFRAIESLVDSAN